MKHFSSLLLLSLLATLFCACERKPQPWQSDNPESDRLMQKFDSIDKVSYRDTLSLRALANQMAELGHTDSLCKGRFYIMQEIISTQRQQDTLGLAYAEKARQLLDSAKYPYENARIDKHVDYFLKDPAKLYGSVAHGLRVFTQYNDSDNIAASYNKLGVIHDKLSDYDNALKMYRKSRDMYRSIHDDSGDIRISRNIVHVLKEMNREKEAYELSDSMTRHPLFGTDIHATCLILADIYDYTKDPKYIRQSFQYALLSTKHIPEVLTPTGYVASKLGLYHYHHGDLDSAVYYEAYSDRSVQDGRSVYDEMLVLKRDLADTLGQKDVARHIDQIIKQVRHDKDRAEKLHKMQNSLYTEQINRLMDEMEDVRTTSSGRTWIIVGVIILLAAIAAWLIIRGIKRRNAHKLQRLNKDLNKTQSQLAIAQIKNAEKGEALSRALTDITDLSNTAPDAGAKRSKIAADIRQAINSESDWDAFEITFRENNPEFIEILRQRNPALTKGDLRLACMLRMGMDNKQIARVLAINADSVKKNRQRLRSKLNLDPETTLPDFLASIKLNPDPEKE